ncbi:MAG: riboflavin biosynthesis protein RibD [Bacteroidetes bacterium]|jgi:diaminohydroxyphosphoribosylaminopyrimidine deaminase/5-amino-6-(5-phosphoribosylamino)uracil reductase|nr:riboflavin biosynthesis protein RibD [Bacteroidota bacterium]
MAVKILNFTGRLNTHETYMLRCLELAELGRGKVAPNPMVGCVIVRGAEIIAEAYHQQYGGSHAEVNAINKLPADFDFSDCTVYVNLEPCSHHGKTPPCSDLLIGKKIKQVVIANSDTNPLVAGKGIEKLRNAGIEVVTGILEKEARELNIRFFTFHEQKRPYIILKWAQSRDGFISKLPLPADKNENWITSPESKQLVHLWRSQEQAILAGANTILNDDPALTTRLVEGNNPLRIIIDKDLSLPKDRQVFTNNAQAIIFTEKASNDQDHIRYIQLAFDPHFMKNFLAALHGLSVQSMIVEGGTKLLDQFIKSGYWDEARIFIGNKLFTNGIPAPLFELSDYVPETSGEDLLYCIRA